MEPLGTTRSRLARDHALIAPDGLARAPIPGWEGASGVVLASPAMGAGFALFVAELAPGGSAAAPGPGVERALFVLEGEVEVELTPGVPHALGPGGFAYVPADGILPLSAAVASRLVAFDKRYEPLPGVPAPRARVGDARDVPGDPLPDDPDIRRQAFLPGEPAFDLAMDLLTYRPGATLPAAEAHVAEQGLLMLDGQAIARLGDSWHPVQHGDAIWAAVHCPRWFAAVGKAPARYLSFKAINRDSLGPGMRS